jgi:proteasome lid subunit RPN8/RPN11
MNVTIPSRVLADVFRHSGASFPAEGCGFLLGKWKGLDPIVDEAVAAENTQAEARNDYFEIDPRQYSSVEKSLRGTGRQILGFYHSHPNHPDVPSFTDLNFAKGWPGFLWMIVQVVDGIPVSEQTYVLAEDAESFQRIPVEIERLAPPSEKQADYDRMLEALSANANPARNPLPAKGDRLRRKVYLTFPQTTIQKPLIWEMARKFDVVTNVRSASISGDVALVGLGLDGTLEEINRSLAWLASEGVRVEPIELGIVE